MIFSPSTEKSVRVESFTMQSRSASPNYFLPAEERLGSKLCYVLSHLVQGIVRQHLHYVHNHVLHQGHGGDRI